MLNWRWHARCARADWHCSGVSMCDHTSWFNWHRSQIVCSGSVAFIRVNDGTGESADEREVERGGMFIWNDVAAALTVAPETQKHVAVPCRSRPTAWLMFALGCLPRTRQWRRQDGGRLVHACRRRQQQGRLGGHERVQAQEKQD